MVIRDYAVNRLVQPEFAARRIWFYGNSGRAFARDDEGLEPEPFELESQDMVVSTHCWYYVQPAKHHAFTHPPSVNAAEDKKVLIQKLEVSACSTLFCPPAGPSH
jgi:hypothetical protein